MDTKKIRYGVIGCGEHALRSHAIPALTIPEFELVALCDPSADATAAFQEKLGLQGGVSRCQSLDVFLGHADLDAVVISSPDKFHARTLLEVVCSRRHVLCEKPLAADAGGSKDVQYALERATANNVVVTSCHPRRFDPPFLWLRENLPRLRAEIGEVVAIDFDFSYHKPSASKDGLHVGLLMDHLNHEFDLMTFLFGFSHVRCHKLADDQLRYHVAGTRDDGITFSFRGTRLLDAGRYPEYFRIRFARGELSLNCENGEVRIAFHETGDVHTPRISGTDYKERFFCVMRNFAYAIRGMADNYLAHDDLLRNTEIGIALTEGDSWSSRG